MLSLSDGTFKRSGNGFLCAMVPEFVLIKIFGIEDGNYQ